MGCLDDVNWRDSTNAQDRTYCFCPSQDPQVKRQRWWWWWWRCCCLSEQDRRDHRKGRYEPMPAENTYHGCIRSHGARLFLTTLTNVPHHASKAMPRTLTCPIQVDVSSFNTFCMISPLMTRCPYRDFEGIRVVPAAKWRSVRPLFAVRDDDDGCVRVDGPYIQRGFAFRRLGGVHG